MHQIHNEGPLSGPPSFELFCGERFLRKNIVLKKILLSDHLSYRVGKQPLPQECSLAKQVIKIIFKNISENNAEYSSKVLPHLFLNNTFSFAKQLLLQRNNRFLQSILSLLRKLLQTNQLPRASFGQKCKQLHQQLC